MAELILDHLCKMYDSEKKKGDKAEIAVNDLNLKCKDGEFIGILGPSGCGKTTTLRMIAGLEEITSGGIFIGERKINNVEPKDRNVGLAFEDYALYPPLTVYDNIAFNMRARKINDVDIKREISRIAPLMKIEKLLQKRPAELSGGQKQRVNIARAIIRKPKLLLLDEPLSHLDGKMRQVLRTEIKRLHNEIKCTTIIVTHDQLEAMSLADRIAIMNNGKLQQFGTPLEIYESPQNEFVAGFIGEPPMNLNRVTVIKLGDSLQFAFEDSQVRIAVPAKYNDVLKNGMVVKMGIRPTDFIINNPNGKGGTEVKVAVFENLGEEKRISIRIGEEYLTIVTADEKRYHPGDMIKIEVKDDRAHIFDISTGERLSLKN